VFSSRQKAFDTFIIFYYIDSEVVGFCLNFWIYVLH